MKNLLESHTISALCQMRYDLKRGHMALIKSMDNLAEISTVTASFLLMDEVIEEAIAEQEAVFESLLYGEEKKMMAVPEHEKAVIEDANNKLVNQPHCGIQVPNPKHKRAASMDCEVPKDEMDDGLDWGKLPHTPQHISTAREELPDSMVYPAHNIYEVIDPLTS